MILRPSPSPTAGQQDIIIECNMKTSEKFCIKWKDFQKNVSSSFQEIRKDFCDVTLAGESNTKILAHKVVLAASSNLFRDILKENPHPHPLLYMKGIKGVQLTSVVDFMYHGEVSIYQEDLNDFLMVAKELQLKGLQGNEQEKIEPFKEPTLCQPPIKTRKQTMSQVSHTNYMKGETLENWHELDTKVEMAGSDIDDNMATIAIQTTDNKISTTNEQLDDRIRSMMTHSEGQWSCTVCGKADKKNTNIINHIEAKHIDGVSHPCNQCGKLFRSRHSLVQHIFNIHKF